MNVSVRSSNSFIQLTLLTHRFLLSGSVSVHFHDITNPLGNMNLFIRDQILAESDDWLDFLSENPTFDESAMKPYLATGTSNGRYTKLQRTFLRDDITPAELLNHFPHKKTCLCIVGWEHYQQEEKLAQVGKTSAKVKVKEEEKDKLFSRPPTVRQKRSRSIMKVCLLIAGFQLNSC